MADSDPIVQTITIKSEGGDQVVQQYKEISDASQQAAQDGGQTWAQYLLEQEKVAVGAADVAEKFGELALKLRELPLEAITALSQAGIAVAALAVAATEAGKAIGSLFSSLLPGIDAQVEAAHRSQQASQQSAAEIAKLKAETESLNQEATKVPAAADPAIASVTKLGAAADTTTESVNKLTAATDTVVPSFVKLGEAGKAAGDQGMALYNALVTLSLATGQSIESLQVGQEAFDHIGLSAEKFGGVISSLSSQLKDFDPSKAITDSANAVTAANDKVTASNTKLLESQKALLQAQIALDQQGGARAPYDAAQQLADINQKLLAQTSDRAKAEQAVQAAQKATADAAKAASDAQEAAAKAVATSLTTVLDQVNQIIAGQKGITFDEATTAATKITAVEIALKGVANQAGATSGSVVQALLQIIAATSNMNDALAIGKKFGFDDSDIAKIREYGVQLNTGADALSRYPDLFKNIREAGIAIGPEQAASFDRINTSLLNLDNASERLTTAWASLFPSAAKEATTAADEFNKKSVEMTDQASKNIAAWNDLQAANRNLAASIIEVTAKISSTITTADFWTFIGSQFAKMAGDIVTFFASVGSAFGTLLSAIADKTGLTDVWNGLVANAEAAITTIGNLFSGLFTSTKKDAEAPGVWDAFVAQAQAAISAVGSLFSSLGSLIKQAAIDSGLASFWDSFLTKANDAISNAISAVSNFFTRIESQAASIWTSIWNSFTTAAANAVTAVGNYLARLSDDTGITRLFNAISTAAGQLSSDVKRFFDDIAAAAKKLSDDIGLTNVWNGFTSGLGAAIDAVEAFWGRVTVAAQVSLSQVVDLLAGVAERIAGLFGATDTVAAIKAWADSYKLVGDAATQTAQTAISAQNSATTAIQNTTKAQQDSATAAATAANATKTGAQTTQQTYDQLVKQIQQVSATTGKSVQDITNQLSNIKPQISVTEMLAEIEHSAQATVQRVRDMFNIQLQPIKPIDFSQIDEGAKAAADKIKEAFDNIQPKLEGSFDFSSLVSAAQQAAAQIAQAFANMQLPAPSISFEAITQSAQQAVAAVQTIFQAISSIASIDLSVLVGNLQTLQGAMNGFAQILSGIDFSNVINGANNAAAAFDTMAASAQAAAQAAADAAAAASSSGGGGQRMGGLFRGRPGTDTNLVWLTDYEFIMRPEAVMRYGVDFMRAINALEFPGMGFRNGGLFSPRFVLPSFAGGGLNRSSGASSVSARPLNLTIGGQTFRGLTVPEDTAKALERAAIAQQISATGVRPHWNK